MVKITVSDVQGRSSLTIAGFNVYSITRSGPPRGAPLAAACYGDDNRYPLDFGNGVDGEKLLERLIKHYGEPAELHRDEEGYLLIHAKWVRASGDVQYQMNFGLVPTHEIFDAERAYIELIKENPTVEECEQAKELEAENDF